MHVHSPEPLLTCPHFYSMSMGFLVEETAAIVWRGLMVSEFWMVISHPSQ